MRVSRNPKIFWDMDKRSAAEPQPKEITPSVLFPLGDRVVIRHARSSGHPRGNDATFPRLRHSLSRGRVVVQINTYFMLEKSKDKRLNRFGVKGWEKAGFPLQNPR
jgi:hypothetical protein